MSDIVQVPPAVTEPTKAEPLVPVSQDYEVLYHDVEYQTIDGTPYHARVFQPQGIVPDTVVIDVHGGAWVNGDRTTQGGTSQGMAAAGVLVVAIDFRQPPVAGYPGSFEDVNLATRWVKLHRADLGARADARVGLFGGSSGGHVVILAGMRYDDPLYTTLPLPGGEGIDASYDFIVADAPVTDPQTRFEDAVAAGQEGLVERHHQYWTTAESSIQGNPIRILERKEKVHLPPMFISQGDEDESVRLDLTEKFVELYRQAGGQVELLVFKGVGHGFILYEPARPESVRQVEAIREFIRTVGRA